MCDIPCAFAVHLAIDLLDSMVELYQGQSGYHASQVSSFVATLQVQVVNYNIFMDVPPRDVVVPEPLARTKGVQLCS